MIKDTLRFQKQVQILRERCEQIKYAITVTESRSDPNEALQAIREHLCTKLKECENMICSHEAELNSQQADMVLVARIVEFVERQVPADWAKWSIDRRRDFWAGATHTPDGTSIELVERDRICALEVWCELFNVSKKYMTQANTREINAVLSSMTKWEQNNKPLRFGPHGPQRGFVRIKMHELSL